MHLFDPIDRLALRVRGKGRDGSTYDAINWNSFNQLNGPEFIERS